MDVTVQAGVTRRQLDDRLRPEGVFFSVDPGADATVGGMVATGASGHDQRSATATMRENVLSLTVVTAGGEIVKTRSRARKSSAGYDLTRLFIGSEGTLGLITEVDAAAAAHARGDDRRDVRVRRRCDGAVDCVIEVLANGIPVARIELLDDVQIDAVNRHADLELAVAPTLFLEFHGTPSGGRGAGRRRAARSPTATAARTSQWAADESRAPRPLARPPRRLRRRPGAAARRARASPPTPASRSRSLAECIAETKRDLDESGLIAPIVGHVGDGNFHLAILVDPDDPDELRRAMELNERLVRRAIAHGRHLHGRARRGLRQVGVPGVRARRRRRSR